MKTYKKTLLGSIVTFFIGTSCCWLSSLAIWLGGVTLLGSIINMVENIQTQLILLSIIFGIVTVYLYQKNIRKKPADNKD
jgi:cellobiose-specific phosphotransferase system component IIC